MLIYSIHAINKLDFNVLLSKIDVKDANPSQTGGLIVVEWSFVTLMLTVSKSVSPKRFSKLKELCSKMKP